MIEHGSLRLLSFLYDLSAWSYLYSQVSSGNKYLQDFPDSESCKQSKEIISWDQMIFADCHAFLLSFEPQDKLARNPVEIALTTDNGGASGAGNDTV